MNPLCTPRSKRHCLWLGWALASAVWFPSVRAASWFTSFDNAGSVAWWYASPYGNPTPTASWDATVDATNNPNSGSLRCVEPFTGNGDEYFGIPMLFLDQSNNPVVLVGANYPQFSFDLKVGPGVTPATNGDYGWLTVGFISTNVGNPFVGGLNGPVRIPLSATNWSHFVMQVLPSTPGLDAVCGIQFGMFSSTNAGSYFTNTVAFNVDNLALMTYCCAPAVTQLVSVGTPGVDYRLRWPGQWAGSSLQFSSNLITWQDTGLESNAVAMGAMWELALPASVLPPASHGFWRMRLPQQ